MVKFVLVIFISIFLVSCSAKFACKDRVDIEGEKCDPITTVYEKKVLGEDVKADKERAKQKLKKENVDSTVFEDIEIVRSLFYEEEKPIRLPPRVIRIWIAPWEDSDGDLHQPSYIYSEISPKRGRWLFGEKEALTTQPILRPMEKNLENKKALEGERKEDKKPVKEKPKEILRLPVQPDNSTGGIEGR